jgi:hypothetical protein
MVLPDLKAVFGAALARPAGLERSAYLDAACRGDAELRARVEALLRAHDDGFLERGAIDGPNAAPGRSCRSPTRLRLTREGRPSPTNPSVARQDHHGLYSFHKGRTPGVSGGIEDNDP